jgi:hypothetical protein
MHWESGHLQNNISKTYLLKFYDFQNSGPLDRYKKVAQLHH